VGKQNRCFSKSFQSVSLSSLGFSVVFLQSLLLHSHATPTNTQDLFIYALLHLFPKTSVVTALNSFAFLMKLVSNIGF